MESIESVKNSTKDSSFLILLNFLTNSTPIFTLPTDLTSSIDVLHTSTNLSNTWKYIHAITHSGLGTFDITKVFKQVPITDDSSTGSDDCNTTDDNSTSSNFLNDSGIYGKDIDTDPDLLSYHVMIN